jgi:hypothetical protein
VSSLPFLLHFPEAFPAIQSAVSEASMIYKLARHPLLRPLGAASLQRVFVGSL